MSESYNQRLKSSENYLERLVEIEEDGRVLEPLIAAIKAQDKAAVKSIIATGIDVNQRYDMTLSTPLHHAAMNSNDDDTEIATLLIKAGAKPSLRDTDENMPSAYCGKNHQKLFEDYIHKDDDIDNKLGLKLFEMIYNMTIWPEEFDLDKIEALIRKGANVNFVGKDDRTSLSELADREGWLIVKDENGNIIDRKAIHNVHALTVMKLLLKNGANPNLSDKNGYTALHYACRISKLCFEMAKLLIDNNADIDALVGFGDGSTPLSFAAESGGIKLVRLLVEKGSSTKDCLTYAKGKAVKKFLTEHGAT